MKIVALTSRSATLELENAKAYYAPEEYTILLNGKEVKTCSLNVFSFFGLQPDTTYSVIACGQELTFKTSGREHYIRLNHFEQRATAQPTIQRRFTQQ